MKIFCVPFMKTHIKLKKFPHLDKKRAKKRKERKKEEETNKQIN